MNNTELQVINYLTLLFILSILCSVQIEMYYIEYNILIKHIKSALNLSEKQIREQFSKYPVCLMEYFKKQLNEKSIEIRFDKEEAT